MLESVKNLFKLKEIRSKLLFTLVMMAVIGVLFLAENRFGKDVEES